MNVQDQLAAFDGWLTCRIEEAHAAHKDLAFRDLTPGSGEGGGSWEYSLLNPGQPGPPDEGWSVYRLQGVWPEFLQVQDATADGGERQSAVSDLAETVFGQDPPKSR